MILDMDADGDMDVVGVMTTNLLGTWKNLDGRGSMGPLSVTKTSIGNVYYMLVEDFNGDFAPDMITTKGGNIKECYNDGNGGIPTCATAVTGASKALDVAIVDWDGDGGSDMVHCYDDAGGSGYRMKLCRDWQGGCSGTADLAVGPWHPWNAVGIVVTDLDEDANSFLDIAVNTDNAQVLFLMSSVGVRTDLPVTIYHDYNGTLFIGKSMDHVDLNGDGLEDLVGWASARNSSVVRDMFWWIENQGNGTWGSWEKLAEAEGADETWETQEFGDFNEDGMLDVVMQCAPAMTIFTNLASSPGASVSFSRTYRTWNTFGGPAVDVAVGDLDGDGDPDLAVAADALYIVTNDWHKCGDGVVSGALEVCDDGNLTPGDGCDALCQPEYCGDGIINNVNEVCDDGNTDDGDGCDALCIVECLDGHVSPTGDYTQCSACALGWYAVSVVEPCVACPVTTTTAQTASSSADSCLCSPGTYGNAEDGCSECPEGGLCDEYGMALPEVEEGYWMWEDDSAEGNGTWILMQCPGGSVSCGGGSCNDGYEGYLCGSCVEGYYSLSGDCVECASDSTTPFLTAAVLLLVAFLYYKMTGSTSQTGFSLSVGVLVNFAQIQVVISKFDIEWPATLVSMFDWLSIANFNVEFAAPECSLDIDYYFLLKAKLLAPVAVLGLIVVLGGVMGAVELCRGSRPAWVGPVFVRGLGAFVTMMVLLYSLLSLSAFDLFRCVERENGDVTLYSSPTLGCYTDEWNAAVPWAVTGIAVYTLGTPLVLWMAVSYAKRRIGGVDLALMGSSGKTTGNLAAIAHHVWWYSVWGGVTVKKFNAEHVGYELLVMTQKLMLLATTLLGSLFFQTLAGTLVCFSWIVLLSYTHPYESQSLNMLELVAAISTWITLFSGVLFSSGTIPSDYAELLLTSLVLVAVVGTGLTGALTIVYKVMKLRRTQAHKSRAVAKTGAKEDYLERDVVTEMSEWFGPIEGVAVGRALMERSSEHASLLTSRLQQRVGRSERGPVQF